MKTYVTTCPQNKHLLTDFLALADLFYDRDLITHIAESNEPKSDQLIRLLNNIEDDYLILMEEDFYLIEAVDLNLLDRVCEFCMEKEVDRFSMPSKRGYAVSDWLDAGFWIHSGDYTSTKSDKVYQAPSQVKSQFGFNASVWKKSFLLNYLRPGMSDWTMERKISAQVIKAGGHKIYALDVPIMKYRDAMRRGVQILHLKTDPLRLVANPGQSLALYPEGDNQEETLCL